MQQVWYDDRWWVADARQGGHRGCCWSWLHIRPQLLGSLLGICHSIFITVVSPGQGLHVYVYVGVYIYHIITADHDPMLGRPQQYGAT